MILPTTHEIEGRRLERPRGTVLGEARAGPPVPRDLLAQIRDIVGGRSGAYEAELRRARETALAEMAEAARRLGADAVVGVDLDYEVLGSGNSMLMVTASGTAVKLAP